jgi:hypothetical protein
VRTGPNSFIFLKKISLIWNNILIHYTFICPFERHPQIKIHEYVNQRKVKGV